MMQTNEVVFKTERHRQIHEIVNQRGRITVPELCDHFGVSEATIRRDLAELDQQGLIRRTHGGAVSIFTAPKEPPIFQRLAENTSEKKVIGKAAAGLVEDGETIFLGSGTTVLEAAKNLHGKRGITVITNSLLVVNELARDENISTVVIGGTLRHSELSMIGHIAEQALREVRANKVFMGIRAIDLKQGLTNDYLPETLTDRAILDIGAKTIVLADHTKCNVISTAYLAPISAMDVLITDDKTDGEFIAALREQGVQVIVAKE